MFTNRTVIPLIRKLNGRVWGWLPERLAPTFQSAFRSNVRDARPPMTRSSTLRLFRIYGRSIAHIKVRKAKSTASRSLVSPRESSRSDDIDGSAGGRNLPPEVLFARPPQFSAAKFARLTFPPPHPTPPGTVERGTAWCGDSRRAREIGVGGPTGVLSRKNTQYSADAFAWEGGGEGRHVRETLSERAGISAALLDLLPEEGKFYLKIPSTRQGANESAKLMFRTARGLALNTRSANTFVSGRVPSDSYDFKSGVIGFSQARSREYRDIWLILSAIIVMQTLLV